MLVDRPDRIGRVQILQVHLTGKTLAPNVDPERIASFTPGFTGADLANLGSEAALIATRRGATAIAMQDFTRGVERIVAGLEKENRSLNRSSARSSPTTRWGMRCWAWRCHRA